MDDPEYALWALTGALPAGITLQAVDVHNVSAGLTPAFIPCALVDTRPGAPSTLVIAGQMFTSVFQSTYISVYQVQ